MSGRWTVTPPGSHRPPVESRNTRREPSKERLDAVNGDATLIAVRRHAWGARRRITDAARPAHRAHGPERRWRVRDLRAASGGCGHPVGFRERETRTRGSPGFSRVPVFSRIASEVAARFVFQPDPPPLTNRGRKLTGAVTMAPAVTPPAPRVVDRLHGVR